MDNPGWHAQRRAQKENELFQATHGRYAPVHQVGPMDESFIGGFAPYPKASHPPPLPSDHFPFVPPIPSPFNVPQPTIDTTRLTHLTAVERSETLRVARMEPHLQFMCGPLLKYDTVDEFGIWHGAVLIVTADSGSIYRPHPSLVYEWDPDARRKPVATPTANSLDLGPHPADPHATAVPIPITPVTPVPHSPHSPQSSTSAFPGHGNGYGNGNGNGSGNSYGNGPSNAHGNGSGSGSMFPPPNAGGHTNTNGNGFTYSGSPGGPGYNASHVEVQGKELWVYGGSSGTYTFWRFFIQIPLGAHEMAVRYSINHGQQLQFFVPGREENFRWAAHSCNGFSAGVNIEDFRGPGFRSGYDPVWMDLLAQHTARPFHVLVGGGDQLYCDSLMREPELQEWVSKKPEEKRLYPLSLGMSAAIDRFFFHHYCEVFRTGAFARANCSIPMLNMCDDHDLIDGFGSYPDNLQLSPVFRAIGSRGYFFFLLFQCFTNPEVDGIKDAPGQHAYQNLIIGEPGPYVPFPSHSTLSYLGPQTSILMLDCRAERKKNQVCSHGQYQKVFNRIRSLPARVQHLIVQVGIPIAYPRMVFLESALSSKYNPLVALGRSGSLGLSGFVNKFNAEAELLDDLNDHWTARNHKQERNWLIQQMQAVAHSQHLRITFLSGDVHCAAVGLLKSLKTKRDAEVHPTQDHRYMLNVVTSAIVNTPPPDLVLSMVSKLATKQHKTLHGAQTDETMIPLFATEPNGQTRNQKHIMGRRNWCNVHWDNSTNELVFDIRVEKEKGCGVTVGYPVRVPPPKWR